MKKVIILFSALCLILSCLVSCGTTAPQQESTTATAETTETTATTANPAWLPLTENGKPLYTVIRSEESSTTELNLAMTLREYLSEIGQAEFALSTDWFRRGGNPDDISEYEILIGDTNRTASATALENTDGDSWCVELVGNRIVIQASFDWLLEDALAYFQTLCTVVDGTVMLDTSLCKTVTTPNAMIDADITIRVGSYNIKNGAGVNHDMAQLAPNITELDLDIVGLQEVDIGTSRAKKLDTLKLLAEAAGYPYYAFTKAINTGGGEYGTAILSRYPIVHHESVLLETPSGYEQRAYGHAVIEVNGVNLHFFNSHLSYENTEIRAAQMAQLARETAPCRGYIMTADFNTENLKEFEVFDGATLANNRKYATYPSSSTAIDNIVLDEGWTIVDSGMLASDKSDHNLLWAEIHYGG